MRAALFLLLTTADGKLLAKKIKINTGLTYGDNVEVLSGLNEGDKIITIGYQDLSDGQLIKN